MRPARSILPALLGSIAVLFAAAAGHGQAAGEPPTDGGKVPEGAILVKGAWSSSSDHVTPLPEGGQLLGGTYHNDYFGLSYTLPSRWIQRYGGPPPSDSGYFVLAQIEPANQHAAAPSGHVLIAAQDLFFTLLPITNALEQVNYTKDHLASNYEIETAPAEVRVANHSFVRFDYMAPVAGLHWRILATQIRCHVVQFIFTSRDSKLLDQLSGAMDSMKLPPDAGVTAGTGSGAAPVCIADYAKSRIAGENPIFTERRFNPVPVRIIIDDSGKVKHIHYLSAFPGQVEAISDAVSQWRFKPHVVDGHPVEVETGIMFGRVPQSVAPKARGAEQRTTALLTPPGYFVR